MRHLHVYPLAVTHSWCCPTHCHMLLHSSWHCTLPLLPLTHPPPKCSRWCLSPVQSGWWMYHWFPSPPRPLLVGCSPPLVEWSTWQCSSQLPQQQPAKLLSELEKCFAHQEWHGHPPRNSGYLDLYMNGNSARLAITFMPFSCRDIGQWTSPPVSRLRPVPAQYWEREKLIFMSNKNKWCVKKILN